MSDRVIRDELLRSHRFVSLSSDTLRFVFIALVLSADDLGNAEATPTALGIMLVRSVNEETAAKWISELADVDLVRAYVVGPKRYVHIPRFRQRLRYSQGKHPRPPENIECNEIKALAQKVRPRTDRSQSQVGRSEEKRSEEKRSEEKKDIPARATRLPADWRLPEEWKSWACNVHHLEPDRVVRISLVFRDFWLAKPGTGGTKLDWLATWRNWIRKECADA